MNLRDVLKEGYVNKYPKIPKGKEYRGQHHQEIEHRSRCKLFKRPGCRFAMAWIGDM